jgi:dTMP kinase
MDHTEGRFEAEALAFHETIRESFLRFAREEPKRFTVIDANQPSDQIASRIRAELERRTVLV